MIRAAILWAAACAASTAFGQDPFRDSADIGPPAEYESPEATESVASDVRLTQFGGIAPPIVSPQFMPPQPPPAANPVEAATRPLFARARMTPRRRRLSRAPDMLGDTFQPPMPFVAQEAVNGANFMIVNTALFTTGGGARLKAAEHNKALPVDRVYANSNHFHNAVRRNAVIDVGGTLTGIEQRENVDRFVLGLEQTMFSGNTSLELRLPLTAFPEFTFNDLGGPPGGRMSTESGVLGNLTLLGKFLMLDEEEWIVSTGLGLGLPTGDDGTLIVNESAYSVRNGTVFLQPFLAVSGDFDRTFLHSFVQVDTPANGSSFSVTDTTGFNSPGIVGKITPPTLLHIDVTCGRWLYRSDTSQCLTGLAALTEFHMTTSLSEADVVAGGRFTLVGNSLFALQSAPDSFTATYLTSGLHAELHGDWTARAACVVPLRDSADRLFDAELLVQVSRRY